MQLATTATFWSAAVLCRFQGFRQIRSLILCVRFIVSHFMNVIILAAGYATRLYPLTLNKAKPLLEIAGRPMIEWVLDNFRDVQQLGTIFIVTNDKFASDFQAWANRYQDRHAELRLKIINDGSKSDDDKLGAIGDIHFVVGRENLSQSDFLVAAGDNLFNQSLRGFVDYARKTEATVAVYDVGDLEKIKKYGNVTIDSEGTITHFEEKPEKPQGTLAAIGLYYYSAAITSLVTTYLAAGNNPDQPGRFVQWLYQRKLVKTFRITGQWLDIGSKETLEKADAIFGKIKTQLMTKE
jgi:glucose-1-phosphate thymidylyltransferase